MRQVSGSNKFRNGILVSWSDAGNKNQDSFTGETLIAREANACDLLNNPGICRIDPDRIGRVTVPG
jgi:hypothetical protein